MTAGSIAEELYAARLEDEELFAAMWDWHDRTGIETRDMHAHYKALKDPTNALPYQAEPRLGAVRRSATNAER